MCYLKIWRTGSENESLFINKKLPSGHIIPLTTTQANRWLHLVIQNSRLVGQRITYHSLRRGYSSEAFELGAPLSDVRAFGNWQSDAVLGYLNQYPARRRVAKLL